jgi:two-component system sensor histidine kinase/response regulator
MGTKRRAGLGHAAGTIIVALTASVFEDERERVLAEGCDDFVRKPFREDEIADMLVKHLGVQFVYAETGGKQVESPQPATLDLTGLPAAWVTDLRLAALEAHAEKILQVADAIRAEHPTLALALAETVSNFGYDSILSAARQSGP